MRNVPSALSLLLLTATVGRAESLLERMTWPQVQRALEEGTDTAIITMGSIEQHGPQLALETDSALGTCLAQRIARQTGHALVMPDIQIGISAHHMNFPGTITARKPILKALAYEYVHSLAWHGFRHIAIVPTHGTNFPMAGELGKELSLLYPHVNVFAFSDTDAYIGALTDTSNRLAIDLAVAGSHSGLSETAMAMACDPGLLDMSAAQRGFMGDAYGMGEKLNRDGTDALSPIGVLGDPRNANVEQGAEYQRALVMLLAEFVAERRRAWSPKLPASLPSRVRTESHGLAARAALLRRSGSFTEARDLLRQELMEHPADASLHVELARCDIMENKIDLAKASLERLLDGAEGEALELVRNELALVAQIRGSFADAIQYQTEAQRASEQRGDTAGEAFRLLRIGYILAATGRIDEAIDKYREGLRLAPQIGAVNLELQHLIGLAYIQQGRVLDAAGHLRAIADAAGTAPYASEIRRFHHLDAALLLHRGRSADAAINFRAALQVYDHPFYLESVAGLEAATGNADGAIEWLERLVSMSDARLDAPMQFVRAHYQLARLYEKLGRREQARRRYREFLDFWGNSDRPLIEVSEAKKRLRAL